VSFQSLNGARISALLSLPIRGGAVPRKLPAIVTAPGYGGQQQGVMLDECQRGYAILQVFLRGPGNLIQGIENPDGHYYQLAYADLIRAIDFLSTHEAIDNARIAFAATSQGGGIALAVSSLDPRIKVVAAHVPFLCHMRHAALIPTSLVARILNDANRNTESSLNTLDYFDPLSLVHTLKNPSIISSGGQDGTCPPLGIEAVFNRIPAVKSFFQDPKLTHTTSEAFYHLSWLWLNHHLAQ
jgi:cephalosporin-C deacetylase